jgi:hypothetical protein
MNANVKQIGGAHYRATVQHWDFIENHGIGYLEGCATKYLTRVKVSKLEDTEKAGHYVEKLIELHDKFDRHPRGVAPSLVDTVEYLQSNNIGGKEALAFTLLVGRWNRNALVQALNIINEIIAHRRAAAVDAERGKVAILGPNDRTVPMGVLSGNSRDGVTQLARMSEGPEGEPIVSRVTPLYPPLNLPGVLSADGWAALLPAEQERYRWDSHGSEYVLDTFKDKNWDPA